MTGGTATDRKIRQRRILNDLTGPRQQWLLRCTAHASHRSSGSGNGPALEEAEAQALAAAPWAPTWTRPDGSRVRSSLCAAESLAALARLLASGGNDDDALRQALDHAERACLTFPVPVGAAWLDAVPGEPDSPLRTALQRISTRFRDTGGRGTVALLLMRLAGCRPDPVASTEVPVLFDVRPAGGTGVLRLSVLPWGPPGLHPDPDSTAFLITDPAFRHGLETAWEQSPFRGSDRCVVWSLRSGEDPVLQVAGGSLAAATAVALDDLDPDSTRLRRLHLRRRSLDRTCAITAGLEGDELTVVGGYENKLAAADAAGLRVVVARTAVSQCMTYASAARVHLTGADDVGEAVQVARSRLNHRFLAAVAAALVLVLVVGSIGVLQTMNANALGREQAQRLAGTLREAAAAGTDPREAALAALAAHRLDPGTASVAAMAATAAAQASTVATTVASELPLADVVTDGNVVLTADRDGTIAAWRLPDLSPLWRADRDHQGTDLAYNTADGVLAAEHAGEVTLYAVEADGLSRIATLSQKEIAGPFVQAMRWAPDRNGDQVLYTFSSDGSVTAVDPQGRLIDAWVLDYRQDPTTGLVGQLSVDVVSEVGYHPDGNSFWLANAGNDVFRFTPSGWTDRFLERVLTDQDVGAEVLSIAPTSGRLFLGTDRGIVALRSFDGSRANPYGGVAQRVTALAYRPDTGLYAATDSGVAYVPDSVDEGGTQAAASHQDGRITALAPLAAPGPGLLVGFDSGSVAVLDPDPDSAAGALPPAEPSNALQFTPSGDLLVSSNGSNDAVLGLRTLDIGGGAEREAGGYATVRDYALRPWFGNHPPYVNDAAADEEHVVAGGVSSQDDGFIAVWDAATGEPLQHLPFTAVDDELDLPDIVNMVALDASRDTVIATNFRSGEIGIWSTTDWAPTARVSVGRPGSLSVSPDGARLAVAVLAVFGDTGAVVVLDPSTGDVLQRRELPGALRAAYDPTGRYLAVLTEAQVLVVLDAATLEEVRSVDLREDAAELTWRPDGAAIAVGHATSGTVVLDAGTLEPISPPLPSPGGFPVSELAWSPDGEVLAATAAVRADNTNAPSPTSLWTPTPESWRRYLCAVAGSDLTAEEWRRLAGDTDVPRPDLC